VRWRRDGHEALESNGTRTHGYLDEAWLRVQLLVGDAALVQEPVWDGKD